jgi:hypothetical protein
MHRVSRHNGVDQVERVQKGSQGGDLVALDRDQRLAEHDPEMVVECRDQMRGEVPGSPGAAHGLAVDRDDPPPTQNTDPSVHPRTQDRVEPVGVQSGEGPSDRGFARTSPRRDAELDQHARLRVGDPLTDRGE